MLHTTLVLIAYLWTKEYINVQWYIVLLVPLMREGRSRSSRSTNGRELAKNRTTVTGLSNFQLKIKHKGSIIVQLAKTEFQSWLGGYQVYLQPTACRNSILSFISYMVYQVSPSKFITVKFYDKLQKDLNNNSPHLDYRLQSK